MADNYFESFVGQPRPECVPLCAADAAYGHGREAPWWYHEAQCPVRLWHHANETAKEGQA